MSTDIQYPNLMSFHAGVVAFIKAGIVFKADAEHLLITLSGGY